MTVRRWTITILNGEGERVLFFPAQGRYTWETFERAQEVGDAFHDNPDNRDKLASVYGRPDAVDTMDVTEVECWDGHFDPVRAVGPW